MTIDDNKEAMAMMRKALGSIENRFREAYNKGYHDGLKEGIDQTTQKLVNKILEEVEADRKTENSSEKPNNCEHITEDGVTCARYPACDDCLDNPLNKVKGSERLVKGSEQTDCQTCKWWSGYGYCVHRECQGYEPKDEPQPTTDCRQTEREGE